MNSLHVEFIPLEAGSVTVVTSVTRDKGDRVVTSRRERSFVMHPALYLMQHATFVVSCALCLQVFIHFSQIVFNYMHDSYKSAFGRVAEFFLHAFKHKFDVAFQS